MEFEHGRAYLRFGLSGGEPPPGRHGLGECRRPEPAGAGGGRQQDSGPGVLLLPQPGQAGGGPEPAHLPDPHEGGQPWSRAGPGKQRREPDDPDGGGPAGAHHAGGRVPGRPGHRGPSRLGRRRRSGLEGRSGKNAPGAAARHPSRRNGPSGGGEPGFPSRGDDGCSGQLPGDPASPTRGRSRCPADRIGRDGAVRRLQPGRLAAGLGGGNAVPLRRGQDLESGHPGVGPRLGRPHRLYLLGGLQSRRLDPGHGQLRSPGQIVGGRDGPGDPNHLRARGCGLLVGLRCLGRPPGLGLGRPHGQGLGRRQRAAVGDAALGLDGRALRPGVLPGRTPDRGRRHGQDDPDLGPGRGGRPPGRFRLFPRRTGRRPLPDAGWEHPDFGRSRRTSQILGRRLAGGEEGPASPAGHGPGAGRQPLRRDCGRGPL